MPFFHEHISATRIHNEIVLDISAKLNTLILHIYEFLKQCFVRGLS